MLSGLEKTARRGEKSAKVFVRIYYFKICIAQIKTEMVNLTCTKYHNLRFVPNKVPKSSLRSN